MPPFMFSPIIRVHPTAPIVRVHEVCVCVTETPVGVGRLQSRDTNRIACAAPAWSLSY
jgi:hypothetical protein